LSHQAPEEQQNRKSPVAATIQICATSPHRLMQALFGF
jgi:hypothetical protein